MVRDEAAEAIEHLKTHGLRVVTLTGDSEKTAKGIAESLGIEEFYGFMLPEEKADKIVELRKR